MTGIEILLLVIGVIFFVASFFIAEKLSPGELNKIGELSNDEIQRVMERELQKVSGDIEGKVEEKVEEHKEVEITTRQTVEKITYKNESFGLKELKNTLFSECVFISCEFDKNMQLDASTDFINCTFKKMDLNIFIFQKVIFDYSTFEDVFMSSRFLHCSFVGCQFKSLSFSDDVAFTSCNFALSNAFEVFDMNKHHMTNIELNRKEVEEDEQLNILLDALYTLLKDRDKELQRSLRLLDRDAVTKDIMADYLMNLNDRQYIEFISEVGTRRRDEEDE